MCNVYVVPYEALIKESESEWGRDLQRGKGGGNTYFKVSVENSRH